MIKKTIAFVLMMGASVLFSFGAFATSPTVPNQTGSCPNGSRHAGNGYCSATGNWAYVRNNKSSCPSGTTHAGAGYCKTDGRTHYVPASGGSCPSGYSHAGAGYCKK